MVSPAMVQGAADSDTMATCTALELKMTCNGDYGISPVLGPNFFIDLKSNMLKELRAIFQDLHIVGFGLVAATIPPCNTCLVMTHETFTR